MTLLTRTLSIIALIPMLGILGCGSSEPTAPSKGELESFMDENPDLAVDMDVIPEDAEMSMEEAIAAETAALEAGREVPVVDNSTSAD